MGCLEDETHGLPNKAFTVSNPRIELYIFLRKVHNVQSQYPFRKDPVMHLRHSWLLDHAYLSRQRCSCALSQSNICVSAQDEGSLICSLETTCSPSANSSSCHVRCRNSKSTLIYWIMSSGSSDNDVPLHTARWWVQGRKGTIRNGL